MGYGWNVGEPTAMTTRIRRHALALLAFTAAAPVACDEAEPLVLVRCQSDLECLVGNICEAGECVPKDTVSCSTRPDAAGVLQPGPPLVEFGIVGPATSFQDLRLRNIGDCTLTIFEVYFEAQDGSKFECPKCDPARFPIELFPLRQDDIEIAFTPDGVGDFADNLILLSDDKEYPEIKVPVRARYSGVPEAKALPEMLDFGYVAVGRTATLQVQITNRGNGSAPLQITRIEIEPTATTAFSFEPDVTMPIDIEPVSVDPRAAHTVRVLYHPKEVGAHHGDLLIHTNMMRDSIVRVPIKGSSKTPPKISVSPTSLQFGAVPLGQTNSLPVTIVNEGGSPLTVTYRWGGTGLSTDLSALPAVVPPVMPGQFTELQVLVTATAPRPITGLLILETNDPSRPNVTVQVSADGQDVVGAQVVKIEMSYGNSRGSFFDNDLRNVDMTLENPFGLVVNKQMPMPTNWGNFGSPTWLAFGVGEEPERIVLPNAMQDGRYRVILQYAEDCASVPAGIVAAVLGISLDALVGYFSGGVIGLDADRVADVIADLCLSHRSISTTVTVFVNGQVVAERPASLSRKGDVVYVLDLVRMGGQFMVR